MPVLILAFIASVIGLILTMNKKYDSYDELQTRAIASLCFMFAGSAVLCLLSIVLLAYIWFWLLIWLALLCTGVLMIFGTMRSGNSHSEMDTRSSFQRLRGRK